ncbi:MAG TPA: hypothetical protein VGE29_00980 [Prosthecobacter sp.]
MKKCTFWMMAALAGLAAGGNAEAAAPSAVEVYNKARSLSAADFALWYQKQAGGGQGQVAPAPVPFAAVAPPAAAPKPDAVTEEKKWFSDFSLRKGFESPEDGANPAKFSWLRDKDDSSFLIDAALQWKPDERFDAAGHWGISPLAVFEAHVSSSQKASPNSLSYRFGANVLYNTDGVGSQTESWLASHHLILDAKYETDRQGDTSALMAELFYTPVIPTWGINAAKMNPRGGFPYFIISPLLGVELGQYDSRRAGIAPAGDDLARAVLKVEAELALSPRLVLTGSLAQRYDLSGNDEGHTYSEFSAIYYPLKDLPKNADGDVDMALSLVSIGVTYKRGEDSPNFEDVDSLLAWVGFRF